MKKQLILLLACAAVLTACAGSKAGTKESSAAESPAAETTASGTTAEAEAAGSQSSPDTQGKPEVKITIKDYGTVTAELEPEYAPITVENFLSLAGDGFYDGLTFHRIISGFMIQGGDPEGTGMGGSDHKIKGEFSNNGVDNPLKNTRGAIAMARSRDNDSASSQFFIVHEDSPHLDGDYAVFGYVTDGMDVVDQICKDTKVEDRNGTVKKENQPVIESIEVIE